MSTIFLGCLLGFIAWFAVEAGITIVPRSASLIGLLVAAMQDVKSKPAG